MAYDLRLEQRIDTAIAGWGLGVPKRKLFGGVGYFVNGNMAFGAHGNELIVRTSDEAGNELLKLPGIRHFVMGSHTSMKNWYLAGGEAIADEGKLAELLRLSRDYALTIPAKR
jgi:TfoX/Sxy family transcriptional regulator of competence genes